MRELSLHILDILENSLNAGATVIHLEIEEEEARNSLRIVIQDNGRGIPGEVLPRIFDPFYTTRLTRRVGLGLSLFRECAKRCAGDLKIISREGLGTRLEATFERNHLDLPPMGNLSGSLMSLLFGQPDVDLVYTHSLNQRSFCLDTREIKKELDGVPINHPEVVNHLTEFIRESLEELRAS